MTCELYEEADLTTARVSVEFQHSHDEDWL